MEGKDVGAGKRARKKKERNGKKASQHPQSRPGEELRMDANKVFGYINSMVGKKRKGSTQPIPQAADGLEKDCMKCDSEINHGVADRREGMGHASHKA